MTLGRVAREPWDDYIARCEVEADKHQPDTKRGGCTCGFCAWSAEHVLIMTLRDIGPPRLWLECLGWNA